MIHTPKSPPRSKVQHREVETMASGANYLPGAALQAFYLLVELSNDAVELCDALFVPKRCSLLDILMLSQEMGLLTLDQGNKTKYL